MDFSIQHKTFTYDEKLWYALHKSILLSNEDSDTLVLSSFIKRFIDLDELHYHDKQNILDSLESKFILNLPEEDPVCAQFVSQEHEIISLNEIEE